MKLQLVGFSVFGCFKKDVGYICQYTCTRWYV